MNLSDIKNDIYFLSNTMSASYTSAVMLRNINIAYQDVCSIIWESSAEWDYDDSNASDFPIGTATLVHNQQDYSLPSTAQRIKRVEVKDSQSNWTKLLPLNQSDVDIALPEFQVEGVPKYYDLIGRSLFLYPTPTSAYCTLASGIQVYFDREITEFAATATTTVPGFATPFHRYLSICAALDIVEDETKKGWLANERARYRKGLISFYSQRDVETNSKIKPRDRKFQRQYQ